MSGFWDTVGQNRSTRRRLLKSGAAFSVGAGALALIGCGSDSGSDDGAGESTGTSNAGPAKPGGNYSTYFASIGNYSVVQNYHEAYGNGGITAYDRPITYRRNNGLRLRPWRRSRSLSQLASL